MKRKLSLGPRSGIAAVVIVLVISLILLLAVKSFFQHSSHPSADGEDALWQTIKQQERILSMYEAVIGVKAREFDGKLKTYNYGVADHQMNAGLLGNEETLGREIPPELLTMENQLRSEMDLISELIQDRNDLTQEIAQLHFKRKLEKESGGQSGRAVASASPVSK